MEGHHHHQQHQHQHHQYTAAAAGLHGMDTGGGGGGGGGGGDRFPQWSIQETRDFLMIRAELDPTFMETKRNKLLWEVLATRMREKGYNRSSDQCKCKWKNLVTRYKGCETMESEGMRQQFPFYNELQAIFAARMQRMLYMEAEGTSSAAVTATASGSKKKASSQLSSDEEDDEESDQGDHKQQVSIIKKKRKTNKGFSNQNQNNYEMNNSLREMLEEFMKQQLQMEMQWIQEQEVREEERRKREMEWKQKMEALENERLIMERRWREREEQRWIREEARADKRDALITALLNKLSREDDI